MYKFLTVSALAASQVSALGNTIDTSSYANIEEAASQHVALNFMVDFDSETLSGYVIHTMKAMQDGASQAIYDFVGLDVSEVEYMDAGSDVWASLSNFEIDTPFATLGSSLTVNLPEALDADDEFFVKISYTTNQDSTAINWLTPAQTAGGELPYLFTQCEDIACRSMAPLQDTPANKITYNATVTVENDFNVKMSANQTAFYHQDDTYDVYEFQGDIKMATYLIALVVGDIEYRSLGDRVGVYTEPSQMEAVAWELSDLGDYLDKAEVYLTPYIWGNYSIVILPPSFPMGGMENPLLTFASPTIITGDKSQVYVATHEIAHSWTGNDVTCENWSNMWLNEGFTVFEERKVSAEIYGEDFSLVNAFLGNISMVQAMESFGMTNSYASLYPEVGSDMPDNSFSEIPYEKGFQLLFYIETLIGEDLMQDLIQEHIFEHQQSSQNYLEFEMVFEDFVSENFSEDKADEIIAAMDWEAWVVAPGMPPVTLDFTTDSIIESQSLADQYISLAGASSPENSAEFLEYASNLKVVFLERLSAKADEVTLEILEQIDADYNLTLSLDPEVKQRWFPLSINLDYSPVMDPCYEFISSMGRWKYVAPMYQALLDTDQSDLANQWFEANEDFYHPYVVLQLQMMLGLVKFIYVDESIFELPSLDDIFEIVYDLDMVTSFFF